jgi:hypothetical protein
MRSTSRKEGLHIRPCQRLHDLFLWLLSAPLLLHRFFLGQVCLRAILTVWNDLEAWLRGRASVRSEF